MPPQYEDTLWARTEAVGSQARYLAGTRGIFVLRDLCGGTTLGADRSKFQGRSILILAVHQLAATLALLELDGIASRLILCPPDLPAEHLPSVIEQAGVDIILSDSDLEFRSLVVPVVRCGVQTMPAPPPKLRGLPTEWLLFTSGTTGRPKQAVHTLQSLSAPIPKSLAIASAAVWSTFYDIRRYGGLQILLRALLGGNSMLLSDAEESAGAFLARAGGHGVTHMSGTPSHWRRALMTGTVKAISPAYIRLSGEIADQAILDKLRQAFPTAQITHAYASTEAGVAFDVRDGQAGFPAALLGQAGDVEMIIKDCSLWIRSLRTAARYAGDAYFAVDEEGFVDTGDLVEQRAGRYYFLGRREGVINVGGHKVHPEEVEAVVNLHPAVQISCVHGRFSPITGAIVVASVVIQPDHRAQGVSVNTIKSELLAACRKRLAPYKVPAILSEVSSLGMSASGKMLRPPVRPIA